MCVLSPLLLYFVIIVSYGLMNLVKWLESRSVVSDSLWPHELYSPWNCPSQNTGVGSPSLVQEIFPTQRSDPGLPHCRWILYQLSHKGSPRIPEWVAYPFSKDLPSPGIELESPALQAILYQLSYGGSPHESYCSTQKKSYTPQKWINVIMFQ